MKPIGVITEQGVEPGLVFLDQRPFEKKSLFSRGGEDDIDICCVGDEKRHHESTISGAQVLPHPGPQIVRLSDVKYGLSVVFKKINPWFLGQRLGLVS